MYNNINIKYNIKQFHCYRRGCWCHANTRGGILAAGGADGLSYYERKVRDGLIERELASAATDWQARDAIIMRYTGYVYKIANNLYRLVKNLAVNYEHEDLVQVGYEALLDIATKGTDNSSSVYKRIEGSIKDYIRLNNKNGISGVSRANFWKILSGDLEPRTQKEMDDFNFMAHYVQSMDWFYPPEYTFHDVVPSTNKNPEELVIGEQKESWMHTVGKVLTDFFRSLGTKDRVVFAEHVIDGKSTRDVADMIQVKSPQTVLNIANRLRKQLKEKIIE